MSCAPKMGGDKAIGCHSHPQGNQELKISYKLFNPPRRKDKANLTTTKSPRSNYGFHFSILRRIFLHLEKKHCERHPSSAACWKPNLTMMALKTMMEVLKIMMEVLKTMMGVLKIMMEVLKIMKEVLKIMMIMVMKVSMLQR